MIAIIGGGQLAAGQHICLQKLALMSRFSRPQKNWEPVQCTGVLTHTISSILKPSKEYFVNEISRIQAISPDDNFAELKLKNKEYIYDRRKFDSHLAKNGA